VTVPAHLPFPSASGAAALIEERRPDERPAFVEGATGRSLSWSDVAARRDSWKATGADLRSGTRIGLLFTDPLEMAAAFLAALAAGVTAAPLNPTGTASELVAQSAVLGLTAVVTGYGDVASVRTILRAGGVDLWAAGPQGVESAGRRSGPGHAEPGRGAALVLSSSGTTGRPKLIPLTEGQLLHTAAGVVSHHRLTPDDRGYSPLPLSHINGLVVGVLSALVGGHRLVLDRRFSASAFWDVADRQGVTWLNLVPAIISVLAGGRAPNDAVSHRVTFARSASAPLPVATSRRFEELTGIPIIETYGMTEAGSQIAANPRPPEDHRAGSVGRPVGLELRVVDGSRRPVPAGTNGQVEIRGANVVTCYWEPAGAVTPTRPATDEDGWLPTGDVGRIDDDGYLFLSGRRDDVINRGGEKVYPQEVEEVLLADPDVAAAAVAGRPHPTVGEEPVAFVLAAEGADRAGLPERLSERCHQELSRFRRPAEILVVDELPLGPNGKIKRSELRQALGTGTGPVR
jgi:acyl-CoA synthetase (AMP-forming)/AMP-acid ligase II